MIDALMGVSRKDYQSEQQYHQDITELYKLIIDMTDRIGQRRQQTISWFLTLNTALLAVIGLFIGNSVSSITVTIICLVGVINCYIWYRVLVSYNQMSKVRFDIIHDIEEYLPLRIYKAEWVLLKEGKDPKTYHPVTKLEQAIPIAFVILYLIFSIMQVFVIVDKSQKDSSYYCRKHNQTFCWEENMSNKRDSHHIVPNPKGGWDVKRSKAERISGHYDTKAEAEKAGREISKNQKTELVIHGKDGKIQESDRHGNDPCPPKDKD